MKHRLPKPFRGMVHEDSTVQQSVSIRRAGAEGNPRCLFQSCWMSERSVCAVFTFPVVGCPAIVVKIASTDVTGSNPIIGRQCNVEDLIHVLVNGDIGVEEDKGFVGGQLEGSELGPGILESGSYEGSLPVLW